MAEIRHRIGIQGNAADIYQLLTTDAGLSKWWTTDTRGAGPVGSTIAFRFGGGGPDFTVTELVPNRAGTLAAFVVTSPRTGKGQKYCSN